MASAAGRRSPPSRGWRHCTRKNIQTPTAAARKGTVPRPARRAKRRARAKALRDLMARLLLAGAEAAGPTAQQLELDLLIGHRLLDDGGGALVQLRDRRAHPRLELLERGLLRLQRSHELALLFQQDVLAHGDRATAPSAGEQPAEGEAREVVGAAGERRLDVHFELAEAISQPVVLAFERLELGGDGVEAG